MKKIVTLHEFKVKKFKVFKLKNQQLFNPPPPTKTLSYGPIYYNGRDQMASKYVIRTDFVHTFDEMVQPQYKLYTTNTLIQ